MLVVKRLLVWLAGAALALFAGYVGVFVIYGLTQGFDVVSGLAHLFTDDIETADIQPQLQDVPWQRVSWLGDIENPALSESSGLAASNLHAGVLWSINDSGSEPAVFAMDLSGRDLGMWPVDIDRAVDWESMDAFMWQGKSYLIIGDTGDNFRWRPHVHLLVVEEPDNLESAGQAIPVAWQLRYTYPDGYRDSEALAVDAASGSVYVLSKRHHPPELFRLPLQADAQVVAELVQTLEDFPRPLEEEVVQDDGQPYRHTPGGMDLANGRLLISTYKHAYLYNLDAINEPPLRVKMPSVGQREALSFAPARDDVAYVSRERRKGVGVADLFKIEIALDPAGPAAEPACAQTPPAASAGVQ